jgi:hypothetical protein
MKILESFTDSMQYHNAAIAYLANWSDAIVDAQQLDTELEQVRNYDLAYKREIYRACQTMPLKRVVNLALQTQIFADEDRAPMSEGESETTPLTLNHPYLISLRSGSIGNNPDNAGQEGHSVLIGAWVAGLLAACGPHETVMARKYSGSVAQYRAPLHQSEVEQSDGLGLMVFHRELGNPMVYLDRTTFIDNDSLPPEVGDNTKYPPSFRRNQVVRVSNHIKYEIRSIFLNKYITRTLDGLTLMTLQTDIINMLNTLASTGAIQRPDINDIQVDKHSENSILVKIHIVINQTLEILYLEMKI